MRRWTVRMVIETEDAGSDSPYYEDHEIPRQITEWFGDALEDRSDQPMIMWSEWTQT